MSAGAANQQAAGLQPRIQELLLTHGLDDYASLKSALELHSTCHKPLQTIQLLGGSEFDDPVALEEFVYEFKHRRQARVQEEGELQKVKLLASRLHAENVELEERLRASEDVQASLVEELAAAQHSDSSDTLSALDRALEEAGIADVKDKPLLLQAFLEGFAQYSAALHTFRLDASGGPEEAPRDFFLAHEQTQLELHQLRQQLASLQSDQHDASLVHSEQILAEMQEERDAAVQETRVMQELTAGMGKELGALRTLLQQKNRTLERLEAKHSAFEMVHDGGRSEHGPSKLRSSRVTRSRSSSQATSAAPLGPALLQTQLGLRATSNTKSIGSGNSLRSR